MTEWIMLRLYVTVEIGMSKLPELGSCAMVSAIGDDPCQSLLHRGL
jgi:hypothetical protein